MFDGTFWQKDEPDPNPVAVDENLPWELGSLLLALVAANCLVALFCPDAITYPGLKF